VIQQGKEIMWLGDGEVGRKKTLEFSPHHPIPLSPYHGVRHQKGKYDNES